MPEKHVSINGSNAAGVTGVNEKNGYLTLNKGLSSIVSLDTVYIYEGKYVENMTSIYVRCTITCIGKVVFDGTILSFFIIGNSATSAIKNINNAIIENYDSVISSQGSYGGVFYNSFLYNVGQLTLAYLSLNKSVISSNKAIKLVLSNAEITGTVRDSSIYGTSGLLEITKVNSDGAFDANQNLNVIIHSKPIKFIYNDLLRVKFWDFYNVSIDINDGLGLILYDNSLGYTINELRQRCVDEFAGVLTDYFPKCIIHLSTTPCFKDQTSRTKGGFHLHPDSPSRNRNYDNGKYIGALPVADGPPFSDDFTLGLNILPDGTIDEISNTLDDDNTFVFTNWFDHEKLILVESWVLDAVEAQRNGHIISVTKNTADVAIIYPNALTNDKIYVCELESATISNGTTTINLAVGENHLVAATGTWTITSDNTTQLRELYINNKPTFYNRTARVESEKAGANRLKYFLNPYNGLTRMSPMCHLNNLGIPVIGDADEGFSYAGHPQWGLPVRVQLQFEIKEGIIQLLNAKS